jgi:hypothetical protein
MMHTFHHEHDHHTSTRLPPHEFVSIDLWLLATRKTKRAPNTAINKTNRNEFLLVATPWACTLQTIPWWILRRNRLASANWLPKWKTSAFRHDLSSEVTIPNGVYSLRPCTSTVLRIAGCVYATVYRSLKPLRLRRSLRCQMTPTHFQWRWNLSLQKLWDFRLIELKSKWAQNEFHRKKWFQLKFTAFRKRTDRRFVNIMTSVGEKTSEIFLQGHRNEGILAIILDRISVGCCVSVRWIVGRCCIRWT